MLTGRSWFLSISTLLLVVGPAAGEPVSFRNDVMAVLSKATCNQGTCHGNQNGKNGFKLSLRGEDPDFDHAALTRDTLGRRTNRLEPAGSLILLKATATIPHEGGRRFAVGSPEYDTIARWIAAGSPVDPPDAPRLEKLAVTPAEQVIVRPDGNLQVRVRAIFSDGTARDVTRLAVYEPADQVATVTPGGEVRRASDGRGSDPSPGVAEATVLVRYLDKQVPVQVAFVPARPDFQWRDVPEVNYIDRHTFVKLRTLRMQPSDLCPDHVFLRRAYLDAIGILPTVEETREFLADARPDKRGRLINRLLERPEFNDFWALKWSDLLRNEEKVLDRKGVAAFHGWIRQSIAENKPLNEFARELLAARGSTYTHPQANFYRALRDPQTRAEAVAQVFLGVRLQCAKCHNHPFDRWTQNDYYGLSASLARVQYQIIENNRRDRFDEHEFDGEQIVWQAREGEMEHPRTRAAVPPRFLGSNTPPASPPSEGGGQRGGEDRLQALADWVAGPDNPFFARTQVNRIWGHLMGRGIVDPIDDFRASNLPVNRALLEALTRDFVDHRFDLRYMVRTIMSSRTYQLASQPNETNREDETNFSRAQIRPLQAEQLLDALTQVAGVPVQFNGYPLGVRAGQLPGVKAARDRERRPTQAERFLKSFGKPDRLLNCECERTEAYQTAANAFEMIGGPLLNGLLTEPDNRVGRLIAAGKSNREIVEDLFLAAVCRFPSEKEMRFALAYLDKAGDRRKGLEDIAWGLVNSKEFLVRQ